MAGAVPILEPIATMRNIKVATVKAIRLDKEMQGDENGI